MTINNLVYSNFKESLEIKLTVLKECTVLIEGLSRELVQTNNLNRKIIPWFDWNCKFLEPRLLDVLGQVSLFNIAHQNFVEYPGYVHPGDIVLGFCSMPIFGDSLLESMKTKTKKIVIIGAQPETKDITPFIEITTLTQTFSYVVETQLMVINILGSILKNFFEVGNGNNP